MRVLTGALLCVLMTTPVFAQATSSSNVASQSGASITYNTPAVTQARSRGTLDTTSSAFAPGLTSAGINSCAGSASVGAAVTGFNLGAGTTYELPECTLRANAAALAGLGQNLAALEVLCQSDTMRKAMNASGTVCPSQRPEYIRAQQIANERGEMYVATELAQADPPPAPVLLSGRARRHKAKVIRSAVAAQVSNSDSSLGQTSGMARSR